MKVTKTKKRVRPLFGRLHMMPKGGPLAKSGLVLIRCFLAWVGLSIGSGLALGFQQPHPDGILAREDPVIEPVGLADWPALDRALKRPSPGSGRIVSFRELWSARPGLGDEPVLIAGVVYRRFRSEPRGQFPSLEEIWVRTDDDGLAVVTNVVPSKSEKNAADRTAPGSPVRLVAYFLRKIRYEAEDEPRIAPWLVSKGFEKENPNAIGTSATGTASVATEADDRRVGFVILGVIAAITILRLTLLWAGRSRRRAEALRDSRRQRLMTGATDAGDSPDRAESDEKGGA